VDHSLLYELVNAPGVALARALQCLLWSAIVALALVALDSRRHLRR
jgi:uncharacterized MnhB-related membrane protein